MKRFILLSQTIRFVHLTLENNLTDSILITLPPEPVLHGCYKTRDRMISSWGLTAQWQFPCEPTPWMVATATIRNADSSCICVNILNNESISFSCYSIISNRIGNLDGIQTLFSYKIFGIAHVLVWLQTEKQNFTWILALPAFQCYQILV